MLHDLQGRPRETVHHPVLFVRNGAVRSVRTIIIKETGQVYGVSWKVEFSRLAVGYIMI